MSILELIENEGAGVLSIMSSIHSMFSTITEFKQQRYKKTRKKNKKVKNEQPWTLAYTLVLQIMSSPLSSFFNLEHFVFPPKWCCVGQIRIWFVLVLDPCLKASGPI
jgi:hypothetical protein